MLISDPLNSLATALNRAVDKDLKPDAERRPNPNDLSVYLFPQDWSDTSCGFGGWAGQAMCTAYTVVVTDLEEAVVYVYGRFAYRVDLRTAKSDGGKKFWRDLQSSDVLPRDKAVEKYGAKLT